MNRHAKNRKSLAFISSGLTNLKKKNRISKEGLQDYKIEPSDRLVGNYCAGGREHVYGKFSFTIKER